jgi:NAD-dependent DNA ligase
MKLEEYRRFTAKSEADKALSTIKGILVGICADDIVNQKEIIELQKWTEKHYFLVNRNPFKEFMQIINEATCKKQFTLQTAEDMFWLCQKYETDYYYNAVTSDLQILNGIIHGILADGELNDLEVTELKEWIDDNIHLSTFYPYDEILELLTSILSDGKIDDYERSRLISYFSDFVTLENKEVNDSLKSQINKTPLRGICTSKPDIYFDGKLFCLTGQFEHGEKTYISQLISDCGGITKDNLTKKTDYLIVGANGDPCWAFSCYGRKIETAISNKKNGIPISIIYESDFWDILQNILI